MSDVFTEAFKKYGIKAIILSIVFAIVIWGFAHWTAAPGSEISVLWGLAKYTTRLPEPSVEKPSFPVAAKTEIDHSENRQKEGKKFSPELPQIYPTIYHNISNEKVESTLSNLRSDRKLRELTAIESGKKIQNLPAGTYFYLSPFRITNNPKYETLLYEVKQSSATRYQFHQRYYELHNMREGGLHIIGFVSEIQATDISELSGNERQAVFSPYPWEQMTSLVSLPINRIKESQDRSINISKDKELTVLDIVVE